MPTREQARRLRATNDSVIKLNHVIHHGGLGHHVQNWYAYRAASRTGQIAAVDCASRIALFCGGTMAEGWACYATDLMEEIGFLSPLERYAQVHARMRMAARALVDIDLHRGAITLEGGGGLLRAADRSFPGGRAGRGGQEQHVSRHGPDVYGRNGRPAPAAPGPGVPIGGVRSAAFSRPGARARIRSGGACRRGNARRVCERSIARNPATVKTGAFWLTPYPAEGRPPRPT